MLLKGSQEITPLLFAGLGILSPINSCTYIKTTDRNIAVHILNFVMLLIILLEECSLWLLVLIKHVGGRREIMFWALQLYSYISIYSLYLFKVYILWERHKVLKKYPFFKLSHVKTKCEIFFPIFVVFSEYLNFTYVQCLSMINNMYFWSTACANFWNIDFFLFIEIS